MFPVVFAASKTETNSPPLPYACFDWNGFPSLFTPVEGSHADWVFAPALFCRNCATPQRSFPCQVINGPLSIKTKDEIDAAIILPLQKKRMPSHQGAQRVDRCDPP